MYFEIEQIQKAIKLSMSHAMIYYYIITVLLQARFIIHFVSNKCSFIIKDMEKIGKFFVLQNNTSF